jgi:hypothetical protein
MPNHFCYLENSMRKSQNIESIFFSIQTHILVDENDINVIPLEEALEAVLYFADAGICDGNNKEKINACTLISNPEVILLSTTIKLGCLFLFISPIPPKRNPTQVSCNE